MMQYVAGLDGGGTKTKLKVLDLNENVLAEHSFGPLNINGAGLSEVEKTMADSISFLRTLPGTCAAMCIASAGISNPEAACALHKAVSTSRCGARLVLVGDHEAALAGAVGTGGGAIIIAGTGSICFGRNESGADMRTGGFGHLIDDEGSGYAIGRDALAAVVRAQDKRIGATLLTDMVYKEIGANSIEDIIGFVYAPSTGKKAIAALTPIVEAACALGDMAAMDIVQKAAQELIKLCVPVINSLGLESSVLALSGSILEKFVDVRTLFIILMEKHFQKLACISGKADAASGAALLALQSLRASIGEP